MRAALVLVLILLGTAGVRAEGEGSSEGSAETAVAAGDVQPPPAVGSVDDDGEAVTDPFDEDGDGKLEPEEIADKAGFEAAFKDIPNEPDEAALEARPAENNLAPSLSVEQFRTLVRWSKQVVLEKMEAKMARKAARRMATFAMMVFGISLLGLLLLLMPLALAKKYPGKGALLLKYSALAAVTFFVTVNLFGGVLLGMRTAQGALSKLTNPSVAIAAGTFDTLDANAEDYAVMGKELFGPALEQLKSQPDQEPIVIILENGTKVVKDAKVFVSIASALKKVTFVLDFLPMILFCVTLLLFIKAIWPTLREIIQLPARAAAGEATGGDVVKRSIGRVIGELKATLCTVGVLAVLTLMSSIVLAAIVGPAIAALLDYFSLAVTYLLFVKDAASGMVFLALFGVVLFLVLNLATLILSTSFFLGKSQKIFQARFNHGVPLATHARYFKWGVPSVLFVQIFPWVFVAVASRVLLAINDALTAGETGAAHIAWGRLLLAGPLFLVGAYLVAFWAARGFKAIRFLQSYKVKVPAATPVDQAA